MKISQEPERGPEERRRHTRVRKDLKVRFSPLWDLGAESWSGEGVVVDLGGGGLRFLTARDVRQGMQLILRMEFPGWAEQEDDWQPRPSQSEIGVLKVIGQVLRVTASGQQNGHAEVAVRFSGRIRL
ncbi:MAG: PilZ domain-containing protein [Thermodesulfobacteriota bacterium]